jgi:signal transduction histidine kinase
LNEKERLKHHREQMKRIEAEIAQKRVTLLADASKILAGTLDYRMSLCTIAKLLVPHMADWCVIDILGKDGFERLSVVHKDPQKKQLAEYIEKNFPPDSSSPDGVGKVLRTGERQIYEHISQAQALKTARNNPELNSLINQLVIDSYLSIPIISRGKVLGAITLVHGESGRTYSSFDLSLIEELAHRVALAIDNSLLYEKSLEGIQIRDEFLNIASHELKTPLTSLQLQLQLLAKMLQSKETTLPKAKLAELLQANSRQVQRLTKLINNLLDVSRITSKNIDLELEQVDLADIISDVVKRFRNEAKTLGSVIEYTNGVHPVGYWDKFRIDQVATNLVSNALKYGSGKPITIMVNKKPNTAWFSVQDHGIGIPGVDQSRIFNRFERTDTAKKFGGLGLGLYITRQIIQAHGGTIAVSSKPKKGATFTVTLPLRAKS